MKGHVEMSADNQESNPEKMVTGMTSVSVIVPALNNAETIRETLLSCISEKEVGEILVVLAPSTDNTAAVVESVDSPKIKLIQTEFKGISRQMNEGLAQAKFPFACKIDADDLVASGRMAEQVKFLEENNEFVAVAGALSYIDMKGNKLKGPIIRYEAGDVTEKYLSAVEVSHLGALLFRTDLARKIDGFRPWFETSEDYDFSFRLAETGRIWLENLPAYEFRVRPDSTTHSKPLGLTNFYAEVAREFRRQRALRGSDDLMEGHPPPLPTTFSSDAVKPFDFRVREADALASGAWELLSDSHKSLALRRMAKAVWVAPNRHRIEKLRQLMVMTVKIFMRNQSSK